MIDKDNYMREMSTMMKHIENSKYEEKFVAFVDIMGIKNEILKSETPEDFLMYSIILYMIKKQPFCHDKLQFIAFSDCMYVITDEKYINELLLSLSLLSYYMLFDHLTKAQDIQSNRTEDLIGKNIYKVRGGITYGKVLSIDQNNLILGKAAIKAYELENNTAVYPRIILDEKALKTIESKNYSDYCITMDSDNVYYLDFILFIRNNCKSIASDIEHIGKIIENVHQEFENALSSNNEKLAGQLLWYEEYLKKHMTLGEKKWKS